MREEALMENRSPFQSASHPKVGFKPIASRITLWLIGLCWLAGASASASIWVRGAVLDPQGKPLARAEVTLYPMVPRHVTGQYLLKGVPGVPKIGSTTSSEDGLFKIAAPEIGMWRLQVSASGFVPAQIRLTPLLEFAELEPVRLAEDHGLQVRILDEGDRPVSGAAVVVYRRTPSRRESDHVGADYPVPIWHTAPFLGRSDESGWLRIPSAERDQATLQVVAEGFVQRVGSVERLADRPSPFRLERGTSAPVKTIDALGRPAEGVLIFLEGQPYPVAETGSDGVAVLSLPSTTDSPASASKAQQITLSTLDGQWGSYPLGIDLNLEQGSTDVSDPAPLELVLLPPTRVRGKVIEPLAQQPVPGALVWDSRFYGRAIRAGRGGEFEIALPSDEGWLSAGRDGYRPISGGTALRHLRSVGTGDLGSVTLELQPIAQVSGQVLNAQGEGVEGVKILPIPARFRLSRVQEGKKGVVTGEGGAFILPRLLAGIAYQVLLAGDEIQDRGGEDPQEPRVLSADTWIELGALEPGESREGLIWTLDPARHGEGWVIDEQGVPVIGAEVSLRRSSGYQQEPWKIARVPPDVFDASTDAEGHYRLPNLPASRYDLWVKGSGFAPTRVPGIELPAEELNLPGPWDLGTVTLGPSVSVRGKIQDEQGRGIEGAEIQANPTRTLLGHWDNEVLLKLESDAEGEFSLDDLAPSQTLSISVQAEGYLRLEVAIVQAPQDDLRLTLKQGSRLTGRVVDVSGWPVTDAQVQLQQEALGHAGRFAGGTHVKDDGSFVFESVAPGTAQLEVQSDSKLGHLRSIQIPPAGEEPLHVEVVLEDGASVSGRVTTDKGDPVAGAFLNAMSRELNRQSFSPASGLTDAEGRFELRGLPEGWVKITAYREPYVDTSEEIEVTNESNYVDLVFETGHVVTGRVVAEDGSGIAGVTVWFRDEEGRGLQATTDSEGLFVFSQLVTGKYKAKASKEYGRLSSEEVEIEILGPMDGIELVISEIGGARVTGRIDGLDLDELSRVQVRALGPTYREGRVDYEGRYEIVGLGAGEWRITAQLDLDGRSVQGNLVLAEGQTEGTLDLEFKPGFELRGTVRINGKPPESLVAMLAAQGEPRGGRNTWTHHDGSFTFRDLEAGKYRLTLFSMTGFRLERDVTIDGDREIVIEPSTAKVAGRVVDANDEPLGAAAVLLLQSGNPHPLSSTSRSDGRFTFPAVEAGEWELVIRRFGYRESRRAIRVEGGEDIDSVEGGSDLENLVIRLESAAVYQFEVRDPSGQAVTTLHYVVTDASGTRVDGGFLGGALGRFRIDTTPAGTWQLWLQKGTGAMQVFPMVVNDNPSGEEVAAAVQPLVLQPAVYVSLKSDSGLLSSPYTLSVAGQDGRALQLSTDLRGSIGEGTVVRTGEGLFLPLGTWTVRIQGGEGLVEEQVLVLTASDSPAALTVP